MKDSEKVLLINPLEDIDKLKALASEPRVQMLDLLRKKRLNINEIAETLSLPQSTVATHIAILENAGLITSESIKAKKGNQKICSTGFEEIVISFPDEKKENENVLDVEMPIGIFTNYHVSAPCGLCSQDSIIGFLDIPESFLNPERLKAGLLWFGNGFVEYKFPNNAMYQTKKIKKLEVSLELSSETPGTNKNWLSDIFMSLNNVEIGEWTSPGDFGDKRGKLTPFWWKLEGSQYGLLKHWSVTDEGSFVDGVKISGISLADLKINEHHSIKLRIGVKDNAEHLGGINIFGRGFGNYDQGILLRLYF
ncbi:MAG TPA: ArsR family transcriptional regulator [Treponemataceae bacterium]|jgi:predicted transcriptional regulator|nr:ArsR family transcriptional regulator [Treponemataceae bacterium]